MALQKYPAVLNDNGEDRLSNQQKTRKPTISFSHHKAVTIRTMTIAAQGPEGTTGNPFVNV
jgi:hypothetical protein